MTHVCPFCHNQAMVKVEQNGGEKYFLCKVDTATTPPKIDITTGLAVDAFGCVKCGTIILNNQSIIQK